MTESVLMDDNETVLEILRQLKQLGVRLAIDDFGTGYSSLSYLHRFPVDMLKIDRSFVERLSHASDNAELARTIVRLGQSLQLPDRRRGGRGLGPVPGPAPHGLRHRPGLLLRPADGERRHGTPPRRGTGPGQDGGDPNPYLALGTPSGRGRRRGPVPSAAGGPGIVRGARQRYTAMAMSQRHQAT